MSNFERLTIGCYKYTKIVVLTAKLVANHVLEHLKYNFWINKMHLSSHLPLCSA